MLKLKAKPLPKHPDEVRMSFGEHLEDLRWRLIKALIGLAIGTAFCMAFAGTIFNILIAPLQTALEANNFDAKMISTNPTEVMLEYFEMCLIFGIGLSAPYGIYQLWQFVAAGLYPHERRWVGLFAPASMGLFFAGVAFFIYIALPVMLIFLVSTANWIPRVPIAPKQRYTTTMPATGPASLPILKESPRDPREGMAWILERDGTLHVAIGGKEMIFTGTEAGRENFVQPLYALSEYLSLVNGMCLAFGLGFQIPIVIVLLVLAGIVSVAKLSKLRRLVILLIVTAGAILTPSFDVASQLLLSIPMYALFEAGLFVAGRVERRRAAPSNTTAQ